jgi:acetyl-CoA C-acetyltransferase
MERDRIMTTAYILDALRTPRGRGKPERGALSRVHPQELLAQTLTALLARTGIAAGDVDDVIAGVVSQVGEQGGNLARNALLSAGFPYTVPGLSMNRFCGSGLSAVSLAAMGVGSGAQQLVVAAGVESMSRVPMGSDHSGGDGGNARLREKYVQLPQGVAADLIATLDGTTRAQVDAFALRSQVLAVQAQAEGRFARSLIPVHDPRTGQLLLDKDESPRADTSLDALAKLGASFAAVGGVVVEGRSLDEHALAVYPEARAIEHVHTAGNSSGLADGAAVVLVGSAAYADAHGLTKRARIRALSNVGSEPVLMLGAPTAASRKALAQAGMHARDIDLWEINEAFASIPLRTMRELEIDPERVNVNGGAIALGHPLGATGAMLIGTALDELERTGKGTALITLCIAGGQGVAMIIERQ